MGHIVAATEAAVSWGSSTSTGSGGRSALDLVALGASVARADRTPLGGGDRHQSLGTTVAGSSRAGKASSLGGGAGGGGHFEPSSVGLDTTELPNGNSGGAGATEAASSWGSSTSTGSGGSSANDLRGLSASHTRDHTELGVGDLQLGIGTTVACCIRAGLAISLGGRAGGLIQFDTSSVGLDTTPLVCRNSDTVGTTEAASSWGLDGITTRSSGGGRSAQRKAGAVRGLAGFGSGASIEGTKVPTARRSVEGLQVRCYDLGARTHGGLGGDTGTDLLGEVTVLASGGVDLLCRRLSDRLNAAGAVRVSGFCAIGSGGATRSHETADRCGECGTGAVLGVLVTVVCACAVTGRTCCTETIICTGRTTHEGRRRRRGN